jgi:outer membrane protein assembly factor BamA
MTPGSPRFRAAMRGLPGLRPWRLVLAVGLLLVAVVAPPLEGQTPSRPEITGLRFEGNRTFSDAQLRGSILTRKTECRSFLFQWVVPLCPLGVDFALDPSFYNPRVFRSDYVRVATFYRSQGFRQVTVDSLLVRPTPTTVEITFRIEEGDPVRITTLDFEGLDPADDAASLTRDLPVQVGDRLNVAALRSVADSLVRRLQDRGYPGAEVFRDIFIPAGTLEGEVLFDVFTGPRARFGAVEVVGNENVSETVIRRMLPFREGDMYSRERLFDAQRNLYGLEIFRHAVIEPRTDGDDDAVVPLQVRVTEGDARRVRAGGGWNTADCFSTEVRWANRNFLGGARRMVLRGRLSNILTSDLEESVCRGAGTGEYARLNGLVAAEFTQPWLFSPRNTLSAALFVERQSVPDVYIRESLGLNLGLTRVVGRNTPMTVSYQPQVGRLDAADVFFCTNFLVCNPVEVEVVASPNVLAPLGIRVARDRTNRAVSPTGGYTAIADLEVASSATLSDFEYQRLVSEITVFHAPLQGSGLVLAGRLRGGWMRASTFRGLDRSESADGSVQPAPRLPPPQKRFYAGGANSVRGYTQNQLGPRVVTVGVEELIFPRNAELEPICAPEAIASLTCDAGALAEGDFASRPTGGSAVLEGSTELRFPVWGPYLSGAAFVDFGQVWPETQDARLSEVVVSPGIGLRYSTPIGPIRLDLAYRPAARQNLPVVTSAIRPWNEAEDPESLRIQDPRTGDRIDWVFVDALARLETPVTFVEPSGFSWSRVQFQFSIGHAF